MPGFLGRVNLGLDRLQALLTLAAGVILGLLVALVAWQVVARYVFDTGLFWADELTAMAVMWAALLGSAGSVRTDSHMRLNLVVDRLPPAVRTGCLSLMDAVIVGFAAMFFFQGIHLIQRTLSGRMASLDVPVGVTYMIVPVSAGLMAVFGVVNGVNRWARYIEDRREGRCGCLRS